MNIPDTQIKIQVEEAEFRASISGAVFNKIGGALNWALNTGKVIPVGTIKKAFLSEAQFQAQLGETWVLADGRSVAGSQFEIVTGNSTIPDMRGTFIRMKDNGANLDPTGDPALGSYEGDNVKYHTHGYAVDFSNSTAVRYGTFNDLVTQKKQILGFGAVSIITDFTILSSSGQESRPRNITCNFFIKIN